MPQTLHKGRWQLSGLFTRGVGANACAHTHTHTHVCAASALQSNTIAPTLRQQPPQLQRSLFSPPRSSLRLSLHKLQQLTPPPGWSGQTPRGTPLPVRLVVHSRGQQMRAAIPLACMQKKGKKVILGQCSSWYAPALLWFFLMRQMLHHAAHAAAY